jgi:glycosyltransferase involved in cell wall biosynthesis
MKNWDVVICTSRHEGTPNPILEGLASGLAVVSTPVGMTPELIRRGAAISLIEGDSNALFSELKKLAELKSAEKLHTIQIQNRNTALKYDWRKTLDHHKRFIHKVVEGVS